MILTLALGGCQTPDVKPFAAASTAAVAAIGRGGDLALDAIAREPALVDHETIASGDARHPAKALAAEWEHRRRATDALLAYSGSLAAIADAAAHRRANATQLLDAVRQLAASVPGLSIGSSAAGNLLVSTASAVVEVKAWRDLRDAVRNADVAIALIAAVVRQDLEAMGAVHAAHHQNQVLLAGGPADFRSLVRLRDTLRKEQQGRRAQLERTPADAAAATELARFDALVAGVERDLQPQLDRIARHRAAAVEGARFYASAAKAIDAWAAAHRDLVQVFAENRLPNVALLLARAQEIEGQLQRLRSSPPSLVSP